MHVRWTLCLSLLAGLLFASHAPAALLVTVQESGGAPIPIADDGPLDTNVVSPGVITVNTSALNLLLTNYQFVSLGAASNRLLGVPASNDAASLTQTGEAIRVSATRTTPTLTVTATDNDYLFPALNPKFMGSAASDTFSFTVAGDNRTFQSFFDPTNTPGGTTLSSPLLAFIPPAGPGPTASAGNAPLTLLGSQPTPFALTNTTIITLDAIGSPSTPPRDQFTGATIITAIPEPAALFLISTGGLLVLRRRA